MCRTRENLFRAQRGGYGGPRFSGYGTPGFEGNSGSYGYNPGMQPGIGSYGPRYPISGGYGPSYGGGYGRRW
jgi:hypothetical protein